MSCVRSRLANLMREYASTWCSPGATVLSPNKLQSFSLDIGPSTIKAAGNGLFVNGSAKKGDIVAVYPGTVYRPGDNILLASINNDYILVRPDGVMIDAKPFGISRWQYKSGVHMRGWGDVSWTVGKPSFPLSRGHIANFCESASDHNVQYVSTCFDASLLCHEHEHEVLSLIPNVHCHGQSPADVSQVIETVVLVATKHLCHGQELLADYRSILEDFN